MSAAGADIWGSSDQFQFACQPITGDADIVARVDSLLVTSAWAKAGVMIRETLAPDSTHAFAMLSASHGAGFQRRLITGGSSYHTAGTLVAAPQWVRLIRSGNTFSAYQRRTTTAGLSTNTPGTFTAAPRWVGLVRQGNTFQAFESPDGSTWTLIGSDTITMASTVMAGLAATSHNTSALTTANFSNVTVTPASATHNQPPTVSIAAPASGATFTVPATIGITASASDADGTVSKVDFYQGSTLIGTATSDPYSFTWNNVAAGSYSLTAVATDNSGATTTSGAVSITVNADQPPSVAITSPAPGLTFGAPAVLSLTASASDPDGTIARVDFYAGMALIGSATASPYSLAWNVLNPVAYTLTAVATDNAGVKTTSAAINITANPSYAAFTASVDDATLVTSYRLDIFVAGADPTTATPIASQDLGHPAPVNGDITVDITTGLQALAPGNYIATVSAIGAGGASRSTAVPFVR